MMIYLIVGITLFYIGDLYTTYINLKVGNIETNLLFNKMSFSGLVLIKTLFVVYILCIYAIYGRKEERQLEMGVIIGALMAMGFYAFFNNIGVFIMTR